MLRIAVIALLWLIHASALSHDNFRVQVAHTFDEEQIDSSYYGRAMLQTKNFFIEEWYKRGWCTTGEKDPRFLTCQYYCHYHCRKARKQGTPITPPFELWLLRWSCEENCDYVCMRANHKHRIEKGETTIKYKGKWPFRRVLGIQEVISCLSSLANGIPHALYLIRYIREAPAEYELKPYWVAFSVININAWLWSTAFHARDSYLTERLDYFCATLLVVYSNFVAYVRIYHPRRKLLILTGCGMYYIAHVSYMQFVRFDYGLNMVVSVVLGLLYTGMWTRWAYRSHLQQDQSATYSKPMAWAMLLLLLFGLLEVFDFPPLWGLLDAHALWHCATPLVTIMTYNFLLQDAKYSHTKHVQ